MNICEIRELAATLPHWAGGAALGWSCFGASGHGPKSDGESGSLWTYPVKRDVGAMILVARPKVAA